LPITAIASNSAVFATRSYLLGCKTHGTLAVIDPHSDLVDEYVAAAAAQGAAIVAVLETHVQADHVSGCRRSSHGLAPPPTSRRAQAWSSIITRWPTVRCCG
jgi:glyoxylase-like metal-dependent hydrolase (beta-lactamase superfamily II)